jgi:putative DNA primase/helicase
MTDKPTDDTPANKVVSLDERRRGKANKPAPLTGKDAEQLIVQLAVLPDLEYAQRRNAAAEQLGIRVSDLDKQVKRQTALAKPDADELPHWKVEPATEPVDTAGLLYDIKAQFCRYIVLPNGAADAIALWVLHAWTMDAGDISPFLVLVSPTKQCGKTRTLTILLYLTTRSEMASNISPSAVFRYIEDERPTLLIDEGDSFLKDNEEMRGILNSGHTRSGAHVIRNVEVNGEHKPRRFSTWAPKAIAAIGKLASTLEDRSVIVVLQRKPKTAKVDRLRHRDNEEFRVLRSRAARWARDNFDSLVDPDPAVPDKLSDRAADNWRPLIAIAELAGADWSKRARAAALILSGEDATSEDDLVVELLKDVAEIFTAKGEDVLASKTLIGKLTENEERPWAAFGKGGKPITERQLARLLRPLGIISGTIRIGDATPKGYQLSHFRDAFLAYIPPSPPSEAPHRHNVDGTGTSGVFSSATELECGGYEKCEKPNNDGHCGVVADKSGQDGSAHKKAPLNGRAPALGPPGDNEDDIDGTTPGWRR